MPLFENNIIKDNVKDLRDKAESKFQKATSTSGSGSEVVRFGSYFGLGSDGRARLRTVASRAANHQGLGAEQEIHASHFGLDIEEVKNMLKRVEKRADKDIAAGRFWMGYDGHQRLMHIAGRKGVGAEQDRYGGHFGLDEDTVEAMTRKLAEGAEKIKNSVSA